MATVKKSCCRNIINKKSIEEKKVDEIFLIAVFFFLLAEASLSVLGVCIT